eukprot:TRINITY_DN18005_c0_g1_i3.p1 TRINITY_DN18005_c0_g1~~TRINITY_DN18005_c0_g1_i3.p1  ORF type:complete len:346 (-),score=79.64 TRINITY_DN18005_c0_g1_i3:231-1190(-)
MLRSLVGSEMCIRDRSSKLAQVFRARERPSLTPLTKCLSRQTNMSRPSNLNDQLAQHRIPISPRVQAIKLTDLQTDWCTSHGVDQFERSQIRPATTRLPEPEGKTPEARPQYPRPPQTSRRSLTHTISYGAKEPTARDRWLGRQRAKKAAEEKRVKQRNARTRAVELREAIAAEKRKQAREKATLGRNTFEKRQNSTLHVIRAVERAVTISGKAKVEVFENLCLVQQLAETRLKRMTTDPGPYMIVNDEEPAEEAETKPTVLLRPHQKHQGLIGQKKTLGNRLGETVTKRRFGATSNDLVLNSGSRLNTMSSSSTATRL